MSFASRAAVEERTDWDTLQYEKRLRSAEVRINQPFCYDTDFRDVQAGAVVYPDQHRLDWDPIIVTSGSMALQLSGELEVTQLHA